MMNQPASSPLAPLRGWPWLRARVTQDTTQRAFATWVLAGLLMGVVFALADIVVRIGVGGLHPAGWTWREHVPASVALHTSVGTLCGLAGWCVGYLDHIVRFVLCPLAPCSPWPRRAGILLTSLTATAAVGLWLLSSSFTPPNDLVAWTAFGIGLTAAPTFLVLVSVLHPWQRQQKPRIRWALAVAAMLLGCLAAWLDMTVLVALYPFVHAVGELLTVALWLPSLALMLSLLFERAHRTRPLLAAGTVAMTLALVFLLSGGPPWAAEALRHTAKHKAYTGRLLARGQQLSASAPEVSYRRRNEQVARQSTSRLDNGSDDACPAAWWPTDAPMAPSSLRTAVPTHPNIVVFYVDTLRYDVATDPRVMPHLARFSRTSLSFTRAYATGSDTRSSLPAMIRGNYDFSLDDDHNVLRVARTQGLETAVAIGKSPKAFLAKHIPHFKFDEEAESDDADPDRKVWGYGANRATSARLVDDSLAWLAQPDRKRFLLWQFHYDLHGWKEMNDEELQRRSRMHGMPRTGSKAHWRYRTVAASIDHEFGRFLRELDRMDMADETIVVFLSDHGEGLGYQGFWLHAVFLWEGMVHVPLMVRVPGLEGRRIDTLVSVIDVAPTLVRLLDPGASLMPYHGEDLLTQLGPERPRRRYPMLMRAMVKEQVARLGVIDADGRRKLVLPVESGVPELYDLNAPVPDDVDIAPREPESVERLMPIVLQGALNPRAERMHRRCVRDTTQTATQEDTLATESRRLSTERPETFADPT